jgi:type IV pilus assembly protein PilP
MSVHDTKLGGGTFYRPSLMTPLASLALLTLLSACSGESGVEVKQWMEEAKKNVKSQVPPIAEPKKFIPFGYVKRSEIDPFNPGKLFGAIERTRAIVNTGPVIDETRQKEVLEGYPLDALKMVGTLERKGVHVALIQAERNIFQVKIGNFIGQNNGKITKITDAEVTINEVVQDATGDNVERESKLELQESKNDRK